MYIVAIVVAVWASAMKLNPLLLMAVVMVAGLTHFLVSWAIEGKKLFAPRRAVKLLAAFAICIALRRYTSNEVFTALAAFLFAIHFVLEDLLMTGESGERGVGAMAAIVAAAMLALSTELYFPEAPAHALLAALAILFAGVVAYFRPQLAPTIRWTLLLAGVAAASFLSPIEIRVLLAAFVFTHYVQWWWFKIGGYRSDVKSLAGFVAGTALLAYLFWFFSVPRGFAIPLLPQLEFRDYLLLAMVHIVDKTEWKDFNPIRAVFART